jgi:pilus assembly protein CpaB
MNGRRIILLSLFLALIATVIFSIYLKPSQETSGSFETIEIVVAKEDIPKDTTITAEMLIKKSVPKEFLTQGAEVGADKVVGKITQERIIAGEPIATSRLADPNEKGADLAYKIPEGKRAITLAYNEVMGVGGYIRTGDFVDVVGTYTIEDESSKKEVSKIVLQNISVLAIGSKMKEVEKETQEVTTITLAITPQEAEVLTYSEERGTVRLLLRGIKDEAKVKTTGVTNSNILQR